MSGRCRWRRCGGGLGHAWRASRPSAGRACRGAARRCAAVGGDSDLGIERHVVEARLPPGALDEAALLRFVEAQMAPTLDRAHPLWRLWCITGLPDGRVGLLFACHHAMTDGLGAVRLARALLYEGEEQEMAGAAAAPEPTPRWRELIADHARTLVHGATKAMQPSSRRAVRVVLRAFFAGWAATRDEPPTSLNDPVGPDGGSPLCGSTNANPGRRPVARCRHQRRCTRPGHRWPP